jgi:hypothetical protein
LVPFGVCISCRIADFQPLSGIGPCRCLLYNRLPFLLR